MRTFNQRFIVFALGPCYNASCQEDASASDHCTTQCISTAWCSEKQQRGNDAGHKLRDGPSDDASLP